MASFIRLALFGFGAISVSSTSDCSMWLDCCWPCTEVTAVDVLAPRTPKLAPFCPNCAISSVNVPSSSPSSMPGLADSYVSRFRFPLPLSSPWFPPGQKWASSYSKSSPTEKHLLLGHSSHSLTFSSPRLSYPWLTCRHRNDRHLLRFLSSSSAAFQSRTKLDQIAALSKTGSCSTHFAHVRHRVRGPALRLLIIVVESSL